MARKARETSETRTYHVELRGVNKQQIFECADDYEYFVRILRYQCGVSSDVIASEQTVKKAASKKGLANADSMDMDKLINEKPQRHCYIFAWCLMGNHVHLLIKEADEPIGDVMKRISSSYVYYYNHKYSRIGHLFQERFKSQPVHDWDYFLTLLRYIHQNPIKPHIVNDLKDYRWSSWNEYLGCCDTPFTSTEFVLEKIGFSELSELIIKPLTHDEEKGLLDIAVKPVRLSDMEIWSLIRQYSNASNASEFQNLSRELQKHYLYLLHQKGIGPRTLSRLTGVPYSIVQRTTSGPKDLSP